MSIFADHDRLSKLASALQSVVVVAAVLVGGGWTVYSFSALKAAEKAALEEQALRLKRPVLNIEISAEQVRAYVNSAVPRSRELVSGTFIIATVKLKNVGNEKVFIDLREPRLSVRQMFTTENAGNGISYTRPSYLYRPNGEFDATEGITLLPSAEQNLRYLFPIQNPGLYHIAFASPGTEEANNLSQVRFATGDGKPAGSYQLWSASTVLNVVSLGESLPKKGWQGTTSQLGP
jgi:hypothetical protein